MKKQSPTKPAPQKPVPAPQKASPTKPAPQNPSPQKPAQKSSPQKPVPKSSAQKPGPKPSKPVPAEEEHKRSLSPSQDPRPTVPIPECSLQQTPDRIKEIWARNKTPVIIDRSGDFNTFLKYKGSMSDYTEFAILEKMGKTTKAEFIEKTRISIVASMRNGHTFAFFLDKSLVDMKALFKDVPWFVLPEILTPNRLTDKAFYKKSLLKPEEDVNVFGNQGMFEIREDFYVCLLFHSVEKEEIEKTINLPQEIIEFLVIKEN